MGVRTMKGMNSSPDYQQVFQSVQCPACPGNSAILCPYDVEASGKCKRKLMLYVLGEDFSDPNRDNQDPAGAI